MAVSKRFRFVSLIVLAVVGVVGGALLGPRLRRWLPGGPGAPASAHFDTDRPGVALLRVTHAGSEGQPATDGDWRRTINTHVAVLQSPTLYAEAIQEADSPIRKTEWFKRETAADGDGRRAARAAWRVCAVPDTDLIAVHFDCDPPEEAALIANELCNAGITKRLGVRRATEQGKVRLLVREAELIRLELDEEVIKPLREKELLLGQDNVGTSLNWSGKQLQLTKLIDAQARIASELAGLQTRRDALEVPSKDGRRPAAVEEAVRAHPAYARARERLELAEIAAADAGNADEEDRLQRRAELMKARLKTTTDELAADILSTMQGSLKDETNAMVANAQRIDEQLAKVGRELGELNKTMTDYRVLQTRETDLRKKVQIVGDEISRIRQFVLAAPFNDIEFAQKAAKE